MGMRMPGPNTSSSQGPPQGPQSGPGAPGGSLMVRAGGMMSMQRAMNPQMQGPSQEMDQHLKQFEVSEGSIRTSLLLVV